MPSDRAAISIYQVATHFENLDSKPDFRGYGSVSPNLAEQRLGSPDGPVRGTAGWGRQHCHRSPSASSCWFFSPIKANSVIAKSKIEGFLRHPRPHARNPGEAPRRSQADIVTCPTCFIRCTSGSVLPTALPLFRYLHTYNSHRSRSSNRSAQPIG